MSDLIVGGEMLLYGDVGGGGDSIFGNEGFRSSEVVRALAAYGDGPLTIRINSYGGEVFEGVAIYNALCAHAGEIDIYIDGVAASAASLIAMAGDNVYVRPGAQIMIHNPHGGTVGDSSDHATAAAALEKIEEQAAAIYAEATGMDVEEIRSLMEAETWLTADEAVSFGFATALAEASDNNEEKDDEMSEATMKVKRGPRMEADEDKDEEMKAAKLVAEDEDEKDMSAAVMEDDEDEKDMSAEEDEDEDKELSAKPKASKLARPRMKPKRDVTALIMDRCAVAKLTLDETRAIVMKAGGSIDRASRLIINMIADRDPNPKGGVMPAKVVEDGRDKFIKGATMGLAARSGLPGGERNEFSGMTLRELARMSLDQLGLAKNVSDPMLMAGMALNPRANGLSFVPRMNSAGAHSTSDFAEILSNNANKSMLIGYEEAGETFQAWTAKGSLTDFKVATRVDVGLFPALASVPEGAEYKYVTTGERKATIQLATYGNIFAITRQSIINDDLGAFTRLPRKMGQASIRTVGNLVYALLTANANAPDSVALFHADHDNYTASGGAPNVARVDEGRALMARQTDADNNAVALNLRPAFFLVPVELEGTAKSLMAAQYDPDGASLYSPNTVAGLAQVISDARLSVASTKEWYLAAAPGMTDTIEVAYLNGVETPTMEQRDGWNVDGVEYKVRLDAGVAILDHRGLYKNNGE